MKRAIRYFGAIMAMLFVTASCDDFLDVNEDPNNPADAPAELLFPAAVISTAGTVGGQYAILGGIWSQYYTQNNASNQYKDIDSYNILPTNGTFAARYTELYSGALSDYESIRVRARANEQWDAYLMATVMQSYTYQVLTDLYGDIAFDEALQGVEGQLAPAFRSGPEVYDSLIARIDEALARPFPAEDASVGLSENDIIFGGDMVQWVRFANTLKLKIFIRQSEARPAVAQAGIQAMYAEGAEFLGAPDIVDEEPEDESAKVDIFEDVTSRRNPLYEMDQSTALNTNQNLKASNTMLEFLEANNDPRLQRIYRAAGTGGYNGMDQGSFNLTSGQLNPLSVSRALIEPDAPVYFISEAESYFLQAEAVLRGWGTGDVAVLYNAGVDASFEQMGVERGGLYAFPGGGFEEQLEAIIIQKWIALAGTYQGIEAFFEQLRTGYPDFFSYSIEGVTGDLFPTRLPLPSIVSQRNPNAPQTPESITTPIWWDID
ncbi:SusD/RagB family nutrient-binding outer membrane lipoprotein [Pontibacter sp. KCTC 32443]|uniref:SusD/RagB family nutrient-binding outer membrane lipoprotein n=1 Tax=Pontibacter TaxID=323449 RepID=UPI00164DB658|nr:MULTISPECIES: SusD/RagB family nutrient-binding outer membrane lipoprotein [Pontibacter]MBC5773834.1 SusD/RagB family nutrient-binding outer membrane lipoprotein [Pontibacter sp. KCTC 32443]